MNSVVAYFETVNVEEDQPHGSLVIEFVNVSTSSNAEKYSFKTSLHEQAIESNAMNGEANRAHDNLVVEPPHVPTPSHAEKEISKSRTHEKELKSPLVDDYPPTQASGSRATEAIRSPMLSDFLTPPSSPLRQRKRARGSLFDEGLSPRDVTLPTGAGGGDVEGSI
ncbi:hypothetical protein Cni_G19887 [Canna indica]|uniref:Uncharacterized protein n=1 Tax=Canna indica TaxID=4628 RepID=A0AAQ3KS72_9LILI|nr:hypothetical protein Cni_G19887 [Canna indica]